MRHSPTVSHDSILKGSRAGAGRSPAGARAVTRCIATATALEVTSAPAKSSRRSVTSGCARSAPSRCATRGPVSTSQVFTTASSAVATGCATGRGSVSGARAGPSGARPGSESPGRGAPHRESHGPRPRRSSPGPRASLDRIAQRRVGTHGDCCMHVGIARRHTDCAPEEHRRQAG